MLMNEDAEAIVEELRCRFKEAAGEVGAMRLDDLSFSRIESYRSFDNGIPFILNRLVKTDEAVAGVWEIVELAENSNYDPHFHKLASGMFDLFKGDGVIFVGDVYDQYGENSSFKVPKNVLHGFFTQGTTIFLSRQDHPIMNDDVLDFYKEERPRTPGPEWVERLFARNEEIRNVA